MKMLKLVLTLMVLTQSSAFASVWQTTRQWDEQAEREYSEWVKTSWKLDVFTNPQSPYAPLKVDCADAVYSMRIIFSSLVGLPFSMGDATGGKKAITNEMSRFDKTEAGPKRVRAFMKFIYDVVSTQSMSADTFPITINRETLRSGALMLEKEKKHSFTVKDVPQSGVPLLYYSTQKNNGPLLVRKTFPSISWLFPEGVKEPSGYRYFRQPQYIGKPVTTVPGYSLEQYGFSAATWQKSVQKKLALIDQNLEEKIKDQFSDLCTFLLFRVTLVNDTLKYRKAVSNRCLNAAEFDDQSTPSRDHQILDVFNELKELHSQATRTGAQLSQDVSRTLGHIFGTQATWDEQAQINIGCKVQYKAGQSTSLKTLYSRYSGGKVSSNPNDDLANRWGEIKGHSAHAQACPSY